MKDVSKKRIKEKKKEEYGACLAGRAREGSEKWLREINREGGFSHPPHLKEPSVPAALS